jgi:hypothetical protein
MSGSGSGGNPDCSAFTDEELNAEIVTNADLASCKNQTLEEEGSGANVIKRSIAGIGERAE